MPVLPDDPAQRAAYWPLPIARAIPAAALALVITFSADHSATLGLTAFGAFAIVSGVVVAVLARRRMGRTAVGNVYLAQGVVSAVLGAIAFALPRGVASLFLVLTVWAALTGALEIYSGMRSRGRHPASPDLVSVGAITAAAAIVFVLIPPEFAQRFTGPDGVARVLDAAIVAVGLLGAYAAIIAVYLVIAGLSAKWGTQKPAPAATDAVKGETT